MSILPGKSSAASRETLLLALLIAAVLATRLPFIMHGLDEWDSANFALGVLHFDVLAHAPHPPGQFVYIRLLQLINAFTGDELFTLSLTSALLSSLALVPYYFTVKQVFRPAVAFGAVVLTAFTPGFWVTSLRMVSDPVAVLFVYGTVAALLAGLNGRRWFLLGMALGGVTLGVKQTTVYFLAPFVAAVNVMVWRETGFRSVRLGWAAFALAVAGWLGPTVENCHGWINYVRACRDVQRYNYAQESILFHLSPETIRDQWQHNMVQPWGNVTLAAVMLVLAALGSGWCLRQGPRGRLFALFGLSVVLYAFCFLYRFNKYFVYYVPIYGALAATTIFAFGDALACWVQRPGLPVAVSGLIVALITAVNLHLTLPLLPGISHFRAPPQAAVEALRKTFGVKSAPLLLTDDLATEHALLYFHRKQKIDLLNEHPDLRGAAAALDSGQAVYFLSASMFSVAPEPVEPVRLLAQYVWNPNLYVALQGRPDLRKLSLYELRAPLPGAYSFQNATSHAPLLQEGMWEDGWCGADSRLLVPCEGAGANLAHLRLTAKADFGYRYPYHLICLVADRGRSDLTIERPGASDFVVPTTGSSGAHTVEMRLLAPQTVRPAQRDSLSQDNRDLSVHLDALECVTEHEPLLVRCEDGWYDPEADGATLSRWTDGNATLSVLLNRAGTLALEGDLSSFTAENAVEILVDGQPRWEMPVVKDGWSEFTWQGRLEAGLHRITFRSRHPGTHPPDDGRILALRVRGLRWKLVPAPRRPE